MNIQRLLSWGLAGVFVMVQAGAEAGDLDPTNPPGPTMKTLQEIYDKIEAIGGYVGYEGGDALAGEILSGKKAWVGGAEVTGTMPNIGEQSMTPTTSVQTISAGYHNGSGSVAGDADLMTGNIRSGVNIFGVSGKTEVVDTTSGDAAAGEIVTGKKAWVAGAEVTGTLPPAGVPKTGQTGSYQAGDDGDYEKGVAWPSPRFTVQADTNCVLDNLTGLIWARNANLGDAMMWSDAIVYCEGLDYGGQTDWRLPNIRELQTLIDFSLYHPALPSGHPFTGAQSYFYWSSTTMENLGVQAWTLDLLAGSVHWYNETDTCYVWPVRAGQ